MTNFFNTSFAAASLAIVATAFTFGLSAGPAMAAPSVEIRVHSSDFATPQARSALDHRIDRAVRSVCSVNGATGAQAHLDRKKCMEMARRQAGEQIASLKSSQIQVAAR